MTPEERAVELCLALSRNRLADYSDNVSCRRCKLIVGVIREAIAEAIMGEKEKQLTELRDVFKTLEWRTKPKT